MKRRYRIGGRGPLLIPFTAGGRGDGQRRSRWRGEGLLLCLAAVLLGACGASGGLYLPDQAPKSHNPLKKEQGKVQQPAAAAPDASAAPEAQQATPPQP